MSLDILSDNDSYGQLSDFSDSDSSRRGESRRNYKRGEHSRDHSDQRSSSRRSSSQSNKRHRRDKHDELDAKRRREEEKRRKADEVIRQVALKKADMLRLTGKTFCRSALNDDQFYEFAAHVKKRLVRKIKKGQFEEVKTFTQQGS